MPSRLSEMPRTTLTKYLPPPCIRPSPIFTVWVKKVLYKKRENGPAEKKVLYKTPKRSYSGGGILLWMPCRSDLAPQILALDFCSILPCRSGLAPQITARGPKLKKVLFGRSDRNRNLRKKVLYKKRKSCPAGKKVLYKTRKGPKAKVLYTGGGRYPVTINRGKFEYLVTMTAP